MANLRMCLFASVAGVALLSATLAAEPNQLTAEQRAQGWQLMFDGKSTQGWTSYLKQEFPAKGWTVRDGWLYCEGEGGGDIVSTKEFDDFELEWDWKIAASGNSGLKYFVLDSRKSAIGHEYQMIDKTVELDGKPVRGKYATGAFYAVVPPITASAEKPVGETNHSRVLVNGNHVEHWLNGTKVVEYECGSPEVRELVAASKFKSDAGFGDKVRGRILLQDHQTKVWFRDIRIRPLAR